MKPLLLFLFVVLVVLLNVYSIIAHGQSGTVCNPKVDILFVLDGSSYINGTEIRIQRAFIDDILGKHQAPKGAVRVAATLCSETNVTSVPFTDSVKNLFDTLNNFSDYKKQNCLESVNFKFKSESRDGVSRIAVILRAGDTGTWNDIYTYNQGVVAKKEKIAIVILAIGIKDFDTLSALQTLASEDATFYVLSKYADLRLLAASLSKDSCKPITLDVSPENSFQVETTSVPPQTFSKFVIFQTLTRMFTASSENKLYVDLCRLRKPHKLKEACIQLSPTSFKRHIPGFGYTRQNCTDGQTLNHVTCSCH